ncbi:DUF4097 family beta strand repeat-containing protein [Halobacillus salinarum]|uniref:DUF4097 family beta strand repeat-containing protein n=1 Tax=Halobacillus salinarum TaxID=2932257 RepID=A0ABY4EN76_9BACI|nr:DUF4097 family beta strand repeat-containing protein [Halobacillus salinarum]UOQ45840.1 DUF4097 family beta strand repeat-containing protein [Halobacillus salinarum]
MSEERMRILKMIEEGTITAEEGEKLLTAVEEKNNQTSSSEKRYGIKDFIGEAVEKIKNADFDLTFGESFRFEHTEELEKKDFNDIDIQIANGSLDIETWKEDFAKAELEVKVYQVSSEEEAKERFFTDSQLNIHNGILRVASPSKKIKTNVHLYIPDDHYEFFKTKLSNGTLNAFGLASNHIQVKTANGSLRLNDMKGSSCKAETGNGSIQVVGAALDECQADTINGSIKLIGEFGKAHASAVTGSVVVENKGTRANSGFFKTTTGSVIVHLPPAREIEGKLKTSFGSIDCRLENYKILNNKKEVMNKQLEFEAFEQYEDTYHIEAETKTGAVTIIPAKQL